PRRDRRRLSPRASRGSSRSPRARARPRPAPRRRARRDARTRRRPARCRRPSGRHRRRVRARAPRGEAIVVRVPLVDVNGAELWVEEEGAGHAVVFVHGGLGDLRLWEPQAHTLSARFRCVRYDLRFFGGSTGPGVEWSPVDDLVGLLDALDIERAALVGLSMGGGLALDFALAHPERVWAMVHVAGAVSGVPLEPYTEQQDAAYEAAMERGDLDAAMEIDFDVWAPLGADDLIRELWRATPDARGLPDEQS